MNEVSKIDAPTSANQTQIMVAQLLDAATRADVDISKMERMFAMAEKMQADNARRAFMASMAEAQAEIEPVARNQRNSHTSSKYSDLAAISKAITPIITKHGFSVDFSEEACERQNYIRVVCEVMHCDGHSKTKSLDVPLDTVGSGGKTNKTEIQGKGSTITYARRYLKLMAFDVSTEDDADGNAPDKRNTGASISADQCTELAREIETDGVDKAKFLKQFNIEALDFLPARRFGDAKAMLRRRREAIAKKAAAGEAK